MMAGEGLLALQVNLEMDVTMAMESTQQVHITMRDFSKKEIQAGRVSLFVEKTWSSFTQ